MTVERSFPSGDRLAQAARALRDGVPGESLSRPARARVLTALRQGRRVETPLASLFVPTFRLVMAGALPVLLLAVLAVALLRPEPAPTRVEVRKDDDRVIFVLANGGREHVVTKSTDPRHFDPASGVKVRRAFVDSGRENADLVFYRID